MPEHTEVEQIERCENRALFMPFDAYKTSVCEELGWSREDMESWLRHGTDCIIFSIECDRCSKCVSLANAEEDHALIKATKNGHFEAVKRLLQGAADIVSSGCGWS